VTVHSANEVEGYIWPFLPPAHALHENPFCQAVKNSGYDPICTDVDQTTLHREIANEPAGRLKICPAGLVECVVPCYEEDRLGWVLFAGVRTPGEGLGGFAPQRPIPPETIIWPRGYAMPRPLTAAQGEVYLEGLRQLGARLESWWQSEGRFLSNDRLADRLNTATTRRVLIRRFARESFTRKVVLSELAEALHLSESRTAHVVREACGTTFVELLTTLRTTTAARLLRDTELPVTEIASSCGFGDVSHFTRTFKARAGTTPGRYRVLNRAPGLRSTAQGAPAS
jgi:AraC-like DNA-binding protein